MELKHPEIRGGSLYVCWNHETVSGRKIVRFELVGKEIISDYRCNIFCTRCHEKTRYSLLQTQLHYVAQARKEEGIFICGKCHQGESLLDVKILKKGTGSQWHIPALDVDMFGFLYFIFMKSNRYGIFKKRKMKHITNSQEIVSPLESAEAQT